MISAVEPDSPADQAGIERGLVIYRIGKYKVNSVKQVDGLLKRANSGHERRFRSRHRARRRGGQRLETR